MSDKLKCPYNIPEEECCREKDCPVYKERVKRAKPKKRKPE